MFACAFDLGASGGRVIVGEYKNGTLSLTEMHRFENEPYTQGGVMYWDTDRLFGEMKTGLKKIAAEKIALDGIGVDTWGVDYGLLDANGTLIGKPIHYRDKRTDGFPERSLMPNDHIYSRTGNQLLHFNTIYQLMADAEMRPDILEAAADLLFMPDLFAYLFTGKKINEYTIASTSQLLDANARDWDYGLIDSLPGKNLGRLFKKITSPCKIIGPPLRSIIDETGINPSAKFVATGSHDTASAVAGTPLVRGAPSAYLSCGTWSLLGVELDGPLINADSFKKNFTNEGGLDGKIRFLKNINGLWLIQQLLKSHNAALRDGEKIGYAELRREAECAKRRHFCVAPNDPAFNNPPDMAESVRDYCARANQGSIETIGEAALAVYNGLAGEYASTLADLEGLAGAKVDSLHMVGGGVRDAFLCKKAAEATGRRVTAGPIEASALGNIIAQLIGLGAVRDLWEGREIIGRSFKPE
ncbi:MAG: rhamnulokinase, partial [Defluviitaleaceae bacterium]|nr:rhamnulokinase [Defluviitaleaceae bacterium]